ncbi:MAG TPA: hypothetical protein DEG65_10435 [Methylophaga sp.]|nr:hypothetical protein [Methylophaga sp.]
MALFQTHPEGLGLFLRPPALSITYVGRLHGVLSALSDTKIATSSGGYERSTSPSITINQLLNQLFSWRCRFNHLAGVCF